MKKKLQNVKSKAVIYLLVVILATTALVSGTLSKYTTTVASNGDGVIKGAQFNFNDNGTNAWSYPFLGATPDGTEGAYETINDGKALAPGQSGAFSINIEFVSDVDSVAVADATALSGTGAFAAPFSTNLDTVAMRLIVSTQALDNPDFETAYSAENPNGYVIVSAFEQRIESVIENCFGINGYYNCVKEGVDAPPVNETVYIYWEWLETVNDVADTNLAQQIYEQDLLGVSSQLTLDLSVTVEQVELD